MLVKDRKIDVLVAIDAMNDANRFAAGASLIATQEHMQIFQSGLATFPTVPSTLDIFAIFASANLTSRPAFFGCNPPPPSPACPAPPGPLVVYIANGAPPRDGAPPLTNTSTFQSADVCRGEAGRGSGARARGPRVGRVPCVRGGGSREGEGGRAAERGVLDVLCAVLLGGVVPVVVLSQ
ncbi:hypothetical protein C8R44DRAFT_883204 [Mycena epipterygia]|nr:hypothetical protein C8R44DRAFT_883204 [Mycena epipterygia]